MPDETILAWGLIWWVTIAGTGCSNAIPPTVDADTASGLDASASRWSARPPVTDARASFRTLWGSGTDLYAAGEFGEIVHSVDAGATWSRSKGIATDTTDPTWPLFEGLGGSSVDDVWAVGFSSQTQGVALHSADRGQSWQPRDVGTSSVLEGIWAADASHVFIASYDGGILRSIDGGTTWSNVWADSSTLLFGVWGSSVNDVYVVGGIPAPSSTDEAGDDGAVDTDADAANVVEPDADSGDGADPRTQSSVDADVAVGEGTELGVDAGATEFQGIVLHSNDGGATWTRVVTAPTGILWNVSGTPDGTRVYAAGANATVAWTTDHGAKWGSNGGGLAKDEVTSVWVSSEEPDPFYICPGITFPTPGVVRYLEVSPGGGGTAYSFEGLPTSQGADLSPAILWGTSDMNVWALGLTGSLWHRP